MTIHLQDLWYQHPGQKRSLKLVSGQRAFPAGSKVAITGDNGAGKSTLLRIVAGLLPKQGGRCDVPSTWTLLFLPANLDHLLLPWFSVRQNLRLLAPGVPNHGGEHVPHVEQLASDLLGRDTIADLGEKPAYGLSSGERVAIALAAALTRSPDAVLLDEVLAHASPTMVPRITGALLDYSRRGGLVMMTTHRDDTADELQAEVLHIELSHASAR